MCSSNVGRVVSAVGTGGLSEVGRAITPSTGGAPGAPTVTAPVLPQLADITPEEKDLLAKRGITVDFLNTILSDQMASSDSTKSILNGLSGLFTDAGGVDNSVVKSLRDRIQNRLDQVGSISDKATSKVGSLLDDTPTQFDNNNDRIAAAEQERYLNALEGNIPVSQGLQDDKKQQFQKLKESAARRGIKIDGDTPEDATSDGTAGNQIISEFNRRYDLAAEQERQDAIQTGSSANLARSSFLESQRNTRFDQAGKLIQDPYAETTGALGLLDASGKAAPDPNIINAYNGTIGTQLDFYTQQRQAQDELARSQVLLNADASNTNANASYQSAYQAYVNSLAQKNATLNAIGSVVGTIGGAVVAGPSGAAAGSKVKVASDTKVAA